MMQKNCIINICLHCRRCISFFAFSQISHSPNIYGKRMIFLGKRSAIVIMVGPPPSPPLPLRPATCTITIPTTVLPFTYLNPTITITACFNDTTTTSTTTYLLPPSATILPQPLYYLLLHYLTSAPSAILSYMT